MKIFRTWNQLETVIGFLTIISNSSFEGKNRVTRYFPKVAPKVLRKCISHFSIPINNNKAENLFVEMISAILVRNLVKK